MKTKCLEEDENRGDRKDQIVDSDEIPLKKQAPESDTSEPADTRIQWDRQREFILSVAGGFIGLGNVWRFPYLCYKNGGGAFLIPYTIFLIMGGIPIFLLEVGMGQFMSRGGIESWNIVPVFKGIGWASLVIVFWLNVYYIVILSWNLFYLANSFSAVLPWTTCDNTWNSACCAEKFVNGSAIRNPECPPDRNSTYPEWEYWRNRVLQVTTDLGTPGGMQWELVGTLALAWLICYGCIWKGVKSTGKSVYVTSTFPVVMLLILVVRGVTLPGASIGISYYLIPDMDRLKDPKVWIDAGTQIFFSYAICLGSLTSLGSYNKFTFNSYKWCLLLSGFNSGASVVSGFAIFSVLGFMSFETGIPIEDVAEKGPGLAFIAYPRALAMMPFPQIWAILFFFMILLLGLASQYVAVEGMCTMIVDLNPKYWYHNKYRRPLFVAGMCFLCMLFALPMVSRGGIYVFQLADTYGASGLCLLWVAFFETVVISWIYGSDRFYEDLFGMFGHKMDPRKGFWPLIGYMWKYGCPVICAFTFGYVFVDWSPTTYGDYVFPLWGEIIGMCMAASSILCVPGYFLIYMIRCPGNTFMEKWEIGTTAVYPPNHPYNNGKGEADHLFTGDSSISNSSNELPTYEQAQIKSAC